MPKDWQTLDQRRQLERTREQPKERQARQAQQQQPKRRREQALRQLVHPIKARMGDQGKQISQERKKTTTYSCVVGKSSNLVLFLAENSNRGADLDIFTLGSVEYLGDVTRFNAIPGNDSLVWLNLVRIQQK